MIGEVIWSVMVFSLEVVVGAGLLYFLYSVWCDLRGSFLN